jgi:hypothetical protein
MPPIRQLFVATLVLMLLAYGAVLWVGGYETGNKLPMNATLANNYNSLTQNSLLPGSLFSNASQVINAANKSAVGVNSTGSSAAAGVVNSVSLVINFMTSIPHLMWSIINFIAIPIAALGVNIGYAQIIASAIFLGISAIAIISAIFLYPI